ncbi:MAG TPA: RNA polymerase sigma factor [Chloroflexia bacterium]|nr:RNA polymerase sigma factor [Chloroflexia bacterium]
MFFKRRSNTGPDAQPDEDAHLLEQAKIDPACFGLLYERYFQRIYYYCLRRLSSPEEAEDVTSLVFTRAWAGIEGYRGGSVAAWFFQIAHNTVANHLRGKRPQLSLEGTGTGDWGDSLADPEEAVLERLVQHEKHKQVAELIAALPPEQRELLALSIAGGLTAKEVGQVLGKSEGAVWMAFHRIVKKLKAEYQRQMAEENQQ